MSLSRSEKRRTQEKTTFSFPCRLRLLFPLLFYIMMNIISTSVTDSLSVVLFLLLFPRRRRFHSVTKERKPLLTTTSAEFASRRRHDKKNEEGKNDGGFFKLVATIRSKWVVGREREKGNEVPVELLIGSLSLFSLSLPLSLLPSMTLTREKEKRCQSSIGWKRMDTLNTREKRVPGTDLFRQASLIEYRHGKINEQILFVSSVIAFFYRFNGGNNWMKYSCHIDQRELLTFVLHWIDWRVSSLSLAPSSRYWLVIILKLRVWKSPNRYPDRRERVVSSFNKSTQILSICW